MHDFQKLYSLAPPAKPLAASHAFLRHARFRLRADYLTKIERALAELTDAQVWWRPNAGSNSIGNLMLHLAGNVGQWMVGVRGAPDQRVRAAEFSATDTLSKAALLAQLTETVESAERVLDGLAAALANGDEGELERLIEPQGFPQTVFDAIFHVVEHFSYHTGQIVLLAKHLNSATAPFYDEHKLNQD